MFIYKMADFVQYADDRVIMSYNEFPVVHNRIDLYATSSR